MVIDIYKSFKATIQIKLAFANIVSAELLCSVTIPPSLLYRLNFGLAVLAAKNLPPTGFCNEWLIDGKYAVFLCTGLQ